MTSSICRCQAADTRAAREAIRKAERVVELLDESHFMASIERCIHCGQHFLTLFCERVDWADSDDPQTWLAICVNDDEAKRLQTADIAGNENVILAMLDPALRERRFLYHDMPKGAAEKLEWRTGPVFIPAHD
jgi:hypothetical protein